jgi:alpha-tubulin suppressor-like RCC1 family protein
VTTPQLLQPLAKKKVVRVVAGYEHSAALSNDGQVFVFGNNHAGQLGLGNVFNQDTPQIVSALALTKIIRIESGYAQLFFLTDDGELHVSGLNVKGQLGLGHNTNPIASPAKINLPGPVVNVASGNAHAFVQTRDGRVFGFGLNGYGELGVDGGAVITEPNDLGWVGSLGAAQVVTGWQHNVVLTRWW